jgi:hypothetical protein
LDEISASRDGFTKLVPIIFSHLFMAAGGILLFWAISEMYNEDNSNYP